MKDLEVMLENKPGALAQFGEILGKHGISLEGGGVFQNGETAIAHFLVEDAERARTVLEQAGVRVVGIHRVLIQRLRQDVPGQLGLFCRRLASAGINILVQYSDHANQLILVVDDWPKGVTVSEQWQREWCLGRPAASASLAVIVE
ncbi:ACT domain-containing protein [Hymenobacter negativus]|uniref:Amino acid-binding ACT domain-containing protein n=1 Tax=Hymenobacter negativus TaxID=2795026 RepID=A0ABS3QLK7_9BACT|nr:ACT domain-containing protein [Hymenobacter negativus]MBO2012165.1 amino acid-binding ACT domain-containing protein [Hymenobacter negativus]